MNNNAQSRLSAAAARLAADAALIAPPDIEAFLLAEFDRTSRRRRPHRYWLAAAAALLLGLMMWRAGQRPSRPQTVKAPAPAPQLFARNSSAIPGVRPAVRPRRKTRHAAAPEPEQPFVAIPYTTPLEPYEHADIIRADLPVSALIAAGFPLQLSNPGARARADLMVGEDGRTRAVRLISISNSDINRSF